MAGPIEIKVPVSAVAAAISGVIIWLMQTYWFRGDVPPAVDMAVQTLVPALIAFVAGYLAPHTPRPDLEITQADVADAHVQDDDPGRHALDGDEGELPIVHFTDRKTPRRRD